MKLVVTEGLDGSGKSTQTDLLKDYLNKQCIPNKYVHFPRTEAPLFGELISKFLRGEFGQLDKVDPYLVALIYAADRQNANDMVKEWLAKGNLVIIDRYVYSNIAFQCAKLKTEVKKKELQDWILDLEFNVYKLCKPDISIFLDAPFSFTHQNLTKQREGSSREYLNGKTDIHEADLSFQERVRLEYLKFVSQDNTFFRVDCGNAKGEMESSAAIFDKVLSLLKTNQII